MTLASVIVFITVYMLILPAISIERETALKDPGIFLTDENIVAEDENNDVVNDFDNISEDDLQADADISEILIDDGYQEEFLPEQGFLIENETEDMLFDDLPDAFDTDGVLIVEENEGQEDSSALFFDANNTLIEGVEDDGLLVDDENTDFILTNDNQDADDSLLSSAFDSFTNDNNFERNDTLIDDETYERSESENVLLPDGVTAGDEEDGSDSGVILYDYDTIVSDPDGIFSDNETILS